MIYRLWFAPILLTPLVIGLVTALAWVIPTPASAYSGTLSSPEGIHGHGHWIDPGITTIDWSVTQNANLTWHYAYTFSHPDGETSHFILEVSGDFTLDDILDAQGEFGPIELDDFGPGPGNPYMPGTIHGIKFDEAYGLTTHISFDSPREPVWGDFYSKDGNADVELVNVAYNAGFTDPDTDPEDPPGDGSVENHILVPDTGTVPTETTSWGRIRSLYR